MQEIHKEILSTIDKFKQTNEINNLRINDEVALRKETDNLRIIPQGKNTLSFHIKDNTKNEVFHFPIIIDKAGYKRKIVNNYFIGENCNVVIYAGCGMHNDGASSSKHTGTHNFIVGKNSVVSYIERHSGEVLSRGKNYIDSSFISNVADGAQLLIESYQLKGIDDVNKKVVVVLNNKSKTVIKEKILTKGDQKAVTKFHITLNGEDSSAKLSSRSVATESSKQIFYGDMIGNNKCFAHMECDALIKQDGKVEAVPKIVANSVKARLVHEATIGTIAGEQVDKLKTLGLTMKECEDVIIKGFLK